MEPKGRNGQPIYPRIFQQLQAYGRTLEQCGYKESQKKPNLFYRSYPFGTFFADLRGTEEVPIWEDLSALFYFQWQGEPLPPAVRQQIVKLEWERTGDIPKRLSFNLHHDDAASNDAELVSGFYTQASDILFRGWKLSIPGYGEENPPAAHQEVDLEEIDDVDDDFRGLGSHKEE
jgi:hypothetical protein